MALGSMPDRSTATQLEQSPAVARLSRPPAYLNEGFQVSSCGFRFNL